MPVIRLTLTNAATYTLSLPAGSADVRLIGGGGAGAASGFIASAKGGGGGEYAGSVLTLSPGSFAVVVGGQNTDSTFGSTTVVATHGSAGVLGGAGGTGGTGDVLHNGGAGGTGGTIDEGEGSFSDWGGGGGGGGGSGTAGSAGTSGGSFPNPPGGAGGTGSPAGGAGGTGANLASTAGGGGTAPGGGGGSGFGTGGVGAKGRAVVIYTSGAEPTLTVAAGVFKRVAYRRAATIHTTVRLVKSRAKSFSAGILLVAALSVIRAKIFTRALTLAAAIARHLAFKRLGQATITATAKLQRRVEKTRGATLLTTARLFRQVRYPRAVTVVLVAVGRHARVVPLGVRTLTLQTSSVAARFYQRTPQVTLTMVAKLHRVLGRARAVVITLAATSSRIRSYPRSAAVTLSLAVTGVVRRSYKKALTATGGLHLTATSVVGRTYLRTRSVIILATARFSRRLSIRRVLANTLVLVDTWAKHRLVLPSTKTSSLTLAATATKHRVVRKTFNTGLRLIISALSNGKPLKVEYGSSTPHVIDKVIAGIKTALPLEYVFDGWPGPTLPNVLVTVGGTPMPTMTGAQSWAYLGAKMRREDYRIHIVVSVSLGGDGQVVDGQPGDNAQKAARDLAYTIAHTIEEFIVADPTLEHFFNTGRMKGGWCGLEDMQLLQTTEEIAAMGVLAEVQLQLRVQALI